jgi:ATP-dependent DNA ligase
MPMQPIPLALAQSVDTLPDGPGWAHEPKFDGDRITIERTEDGVVVRSKSGRVVTSTWLDLAVAAMDLPPGVLLDGEAVIYQADRLDFGAVRRRASAGATRLASLIRDHPASFAAFDVLHHTGHGGDLRSRPYRERRAVLVETLAPLGPPLQAVPMTEDPETARLWWATLREMNVEGIVSKRLDGAYPGGRRGWRKLRHSDTVDADVVGHTGTRAHPVALALRLSDGRTVLSRRITAPVRAAVAAHLAGTAPAAPIHTDDGARYVPCAPGVVVEVEAGTTRHATVTVTRVRGE